jgi:hypothetical protein
VKTTNHRPILANTAHDLMTNARAHRASRPDLRMLVEEVGELASALAGDHEHDPEFELVQIGGIALHWLINIRDPENEDWA